MTVVDPKLVAHIALLANIPMSASQISQFAPQLSSVLDYTQQVSAMDTAGVEETSQVTGLENVLREDVVDVSSMFTQEEALMNSKHTHNGYFVVPAVFDE